MGRIIGLVKKEMPITVEVKETEKEKTEAVKKAVPRTTKKVTKADK